MLLASRYRAAKVDRLSLADLILTLGSFNVNKIGSLGMV